MAELKEAALSFVQGSVETIMTSKIADDFQQDFFKDYVVGKLRSQEMMGD